MGAPVSQASPSTPQFLRSHGQMVGSTIMHAMDGRGNGPGWGLQHRSPAQVSGPGTGQAVGRTQDGDSGASASQPACPRLTKFNFPTLSKGRGCLPPPKKKFLNFSPNSAVKAAPEGGACTLIRRRLRSGDSDWRAWSGAGKSGRGGGERPSPPAGSARAGSGLISNRGLDCSWTVTSTLPARRPASPGPGVSLGHPPQRGV